MTTPTVPVTVNLAAMGGPALPNITVIATLDANEVYNGVVVAMKVSAKTDSSGVAVLNLFPNAPAPSGFGTRGTSYRITATIPGGRSLNVDARVPNSACRLENILVLEEVGPLSSAELALLQAQSSLSEVSANAAAAAASALAASGSAGTAGVKAAEAAGSKAGADAAAAAALASKNAADAAAAAAGDSADAAEAARLAAEAALAGGGGSGVDPDSLADVASLTGDERVAVKQAGNQRGLDVSVLQDFLLQGGKDAAFQILSAISMAFGTKYGYSGTIGVGGGKVTQANNKSQAVTLNCAAGQVTLNAQALAAGSQVSFTMNNSYIAADDEVYVWKKGGGTAGAYEVEVDSVSAGSCSILVRNKTGGSLAEALVIGFSVKSAAITPVLGSGGAGGMLTGLNLGSVNNYGGSIPLANLAHLMGPWTQTVGSGSFTQNLGELVASVPTDEFRASFSDGGLGIPGGVYTVLNPQGAQIMIHNYVGDDYTGGFTTATNFTINVNANKQLLVTVRGSLLKTLGNFALIIPGHASSYANGNPWNQQFLDFLNLLAPQVLRFMDMVCTNVDINTNFSERVTPAGISFFSNRLQQSALPYEYAIDLANRLTRDPWVPIPVRAGGAGSAYVTGMANLFNNGTGAVATPGTTGVIGGSGLAAGRYWYPEPGNELWNYGNAVFAANTYWMKYFFHAKTLVTVDPATGIFTHTGHGKADAAVIGVFITNNARLAGTGEGAVWQTMLGHDMYVDLIDANHYRLRNQANPVGATVFGAGYYPAGITDALIVTPASATADLDANYGTVAKANWDICDPIMGASRIKHVISSAAAATGLSAARLAVSGVAARTDGLAIAPYFSGDYWMASLDVTSSTSITAGFWSYGSAQGGSGTLYVNVYPAGTAKPTDDALKAGTGVVSGGHQTLAYDFPYAKTFTRLAAVTGLTTSTPVRVFFSYQPKNQDGTPGNYLWTWYQEITPTAAKVGTSTTSLAVNTSQKTLTTQTGKAWVAGDAITLARQADASVTIEGTVSSYNSGTGALVVDVVCATGAGTFTDWNVCKREYVPNTNANQAMVNRQHIRDGVLGGVSPLSYGVLGHMAVIAASGNAAIKTIAYEGGNHMNAASAEPPVVTSWLLNTYLESADYAAVMNYLHHHVSNLGMALHCWYQDVALSVWSIANSYADTSDLRAQKFASYGGFVDHGTTVNIADVNAPAIATAPSSLPYTIHTFADPSLTYSLMPDAEAGTGNYDMVGAAVRMIGTTGISFASPQSRTLRVLASDGNTDKVVAVAFATGDAWYESDAFWALDMTAQSNLASLTPVSGKGNALPAVGTGGAFSGGMLDLQNTQSYSNDNATTGTAQMNEPICMSEVMDVANATTATYQNVVMKLGLSPTIEIEAVTAAGVPKVLINWFTNDPPTGDTAEYPQITFPAGKHVVTILWEPSTLRWRLWIDLTEQTPAQLLDQTAKVLGRKIQWYGNVKLGSSQYVRRAGLTAAYVTGTIIPKMKAKHGI